MKLYIIGNGFDVFHGLPTRYSDFRSYIISLYPDAEDSIDYIPDSYEFPNGGTRFDEELVAQFIVTVLDSCGVKEWNRREEYLSDDMFDVFRWYPESLIIITKKLDIFL